MSSTVSAELRCWSGSVRLGQDRTGEDFGRQILVGWQSQGETAGWHEAGGDGDQPPLEGGDHGLAAADTVPGQLPVVAAGGEVVHQPAVVAASSAPHIQAWLVHTC